MRIMRVTLDIWLWYTHEIARAARLVAGRNAKVVLAVQGLLVRKVAKKVWQDWLVAVGMRRLGDTVQIKIEVLRAMGLPLVKRHSLQGKPDPNAFVQIWVAEHGSGGHPPQHVPSPHPEPEQHAVGAAPVPVSAVTKVQWGTRTPKWSQSLRLVTLLQSTSCKDEAANADANSSQKDHQAQLLRVVVCDKGNSNFVQNGRSVSSLRASGDRSLSQVRVIANVSVAVC